MSANISFMVAVKEMATISNVWRIVKKHVAVRPFDILSSDIFCVYKTHVNLGAQSKTSPRITPSTATATVPEVPSTQQPPTEEEKATTIASWSTPQETETGSTTLEQGSSTWEQGSSSTWQQTSDVTSDSSSTDRFYI